MEHYNKVKTIKVEAKEATILLVVAIFGGAWSTLVAGYAFNKDEDLKKSALILFFMQWAAMFLCGAGWIWAIMTALAIKKNC